MGQRLDTAYDITPKMIDPNAPPEELEAHVPGVDGWGEYGGAVAAEIEHEYGAAVDPELVRRMDNEVLRDLAAFAAEHPELDLSRLVLIEGLMVPLDGPSEAASSRATPKERAAALARVTRWSYSRGWYAMAKDPEEGEI